ncbi:MAG: hypothetical protein KF712_07755 [Akkermansiaceae bacterium]|nr:hypothetical protein [Akkermansiaceae bacterium]
MLWKRGIEEIWSLRERLEQASGEESGLAEEWNKTTTHNQDAMVSEL